MNLYDINRYIEFLKLLPSRVLELSYVMGRPLHILLKLFHICLGKNLKNITNICGKSSRSFQKEQRRFLQI